jgi:serine/tyrosine/threonine adenylyltransferase
VFNSIDSFGRYAYRNQPRVAQWNLARPAECLLPLPGEDQERALASAQKALAAFGPALRGGLSRRPAAQDRPLRGSRGHAELVQETCCGAWRRTAPTSR